MIAIERLRALEKAAELVAKANVPELEPFGGEVSAKDGDVVADCYYNAAHENDAEDVSRAIVAAVNFIREHGSALIAELGQEVGAVADGAALLVRDVCEMDPADPDAPDTVCIRVADLTRVAELYTSPAHTSEARDAARKEAYDVVDDFLRDSLGDEAYAKYSDALEIACGYQDAAMEASR